MDDLETLETQGALLRLLRGSGMKYLSALAAAVFAVAVWQGIVWITGLPKFILPGPALVAETWWQNRWLIAEHTWITAVEVVIGLGVGHGAGGGHGVATGQFPGGAGAGATDAGLSPRRCRSLRWPRC